jgi:hypothetical protein
LLFCLSLLLHLLLFFIFLVLFSLVLRSLQSGQLNGHETMLKADSRFLRCAILFCHCLLTPGSVSWVQSSPSLAWSLKALQVFGREARLALLDMLYR